MFRLSLTLPAAPLRSNYVSELTAVELPQPNRLLPAGGSSTRRYTVQ